MPFGGMPFGGMSVGGMSVRGMSRPASLQLSLNGAAGGATAGAAARVAAGADAEATAGAAGSYHSCARHVHVIKVSFLGPTSTLRHDTRIFLM